MEHTTFRRFTDDELIRHLETVRDPMTTTDAEVELLGRFKNLLDDAPLPHTLDVAIDDSAVSADDLPELVRILDEFSAESPSTLREKLQRANTFYDIANDAGDVISRLSDLVNNTL